MQICQGLEKHVALFESEKKWLSYDRKAEKIHVLYHPLSNHNVEGSTLIYTLESAPTVQKQTAVILETISNNESGLSVWNPYF